MFACGKQKKVYSLPVGGDETILRNPTRWTQFKKKNQIQIWLAYNWNVFTYQPLWSTSCLKLNEANAYSSSSHLYSTSALKFSFRLISIPKNGVAQRKLVHLVARAFYSQNRKSIRTFKNGNMSKPRLYTTPYSVAYFYNKDRRIRSLT